MALKKERKDIVEIVLSVDGAKGKLLYTNVGSEMHQYAQSQGWKNNIVEYFGPLQDNFNFNELIHCGFSIEIGGVQIKDKHLRNIATPEECSYLHEEIYG